MIAILCIIRVAVSAAILSLAGVSFIPREAANRLIPLQKLLTNMIEARRNGGRT